ncbi:MAG: OB-fold nucleic acid binding domain-containing protein [Actinomycetota bacterium]
MGILEKLNESDEQIHAHNTREWCRELPGILDASRCEPGARCKIAGVVESIKLVPNRFSQTLEVTLFDGTDRMVGVWLGRRSIPGIDLGSRIVLEGTVGAFRPGPLQIINPAYELLAI